MATYKYSEYLYQLDHNAFDTLHSPGAITPHSGIYRCMACGAEVVSERGKPLPPQNHHVHESGLGAIRWKMVVYADHDPK